MKHYFEVSAKENIGIKEMADFAARVRVGSNYEKFPHAIK
jgi:hypothetical protein